MTADGETQPHPVRLQSAPWRWQLASYDAVGAPRPSDKAAGVFMV